MTTTDKLALCVSNRLTNSKHRYKNLCEGFSYFHKPCAETDLQYLTHVMIKDNTGKYNKYPRALFKNAILAYKSCNDRLEDFDFTPEKEAIAIKAELEAERESIIFATANCLRLEEKLKLITAKIPKNIVEVLVGNNHSEISYVNTKITQSLYSLRCNAEKENFYIPPAFLNIRNGGNYSYAGFHLGSYDKCEWKIVRDNDGVAVLIGQTVSEYKP